MLRYLTLPGSDPLCLLYVGICSAVSSVCLECLLTKVVVRSDQDSFVNFMCYCCTLLDDFSRENENNLFRET